MPYVETTSEGTDESRDIRMVTMRIVDQLEQPQAEGALTCAPSRTHTEPSWRINSIPAPLKGSS